MLQSEMHLRGSSAKNVELHGGGAKQAEIKSETFPEILRAKEALQDDRSK